MNLNEMERLAREATPGPWECVEETKVKFSPTNHVERHYSRLWDFSYRQFTCWHDGDKGSVLEIIGEMPWVQFDPSKANERDAKYIASVSPDVMLSIIKYIRELEAKVNEKI